MEPQMKISVLVNTFNESLNIRHCLESVKWADEIVVVDMHSDDDTAKIAGEFTDKIYLFERMGYADPARQFGLAKTTGDWVLLVDADEMVPLALKQRLLLIATGDLADAVVVPHHNYFFGHLMRGTRWGAFQDVHYRFYKRRAVEFTSEVHDYIKIGPEARIYKITDPREGFMHFNYIDMEHFLVKFNNYTSVEAKNMFAGIKPVPSVAKLLFQMNKEWVGRYLKNQGYRDGLQGFVLSVMMAAYKLTAYFKYRLMKKYGTPDVRAKVLAEYEAIARQIMAEYKQDEAAA